MSVKQYVLLGAVVVCAVTGSFPAYACTASWRNGTDSTVIVTYVVKYAFPGDHAVFNGANPVVSPPAVYVVPVVPGQYTSYNWGGRWRGVDGDGVYRLRRADRPVHERVGTAVLSRSS
jgi:hypothetical protein